MPYTYIFLSAIGFRYSRFILNLVGNWLYKPYPSPRNPSFSSENVTCYIPSVDCDGGEFEKTIRTALCCGVKKVYVPVPKDSEERAKRTCNPLGTNVHVIPCAGPANKRTQTCAALRQIARDVQTEGETCVAEEARTKLVLSLDDHVWAERPAEFLRDTMAPFENPRIGGVAVGKRVERRQDQPSSSSVAASFDKSLNFIARNYLERHNWELRASNYWDGGVFVISGRAACFRAQILTAPDFIEAFTNEYFARPVFGKLVGPLHADDDNFITRWLIMKGWEIKFQYTEHSFIITSLGVSGPQKWLQQCIRWSRTTIRSNTTSLSERRVWHTYPYTTVMVYIPALFNYALLIDPALLWLGWHASGENRTVACCLLGFWMLVTKIVKIIPNIRDHPEDIMRLPSQLAFAYFHSFIKLYSAITFWSLSWGSRPDKGTNVALRDEDVKSTF
ncbi:hypothetical protein FB451DRAFT_1526626 [Mycena latifolia]|nr:hypothetical protein FB451DRAFT_1526626 [Mycena latifolia]